LSPRLGVTFSKRQKELARQEKRRAKAQRKEQRKAEGLAAAAVPDLEATPVNDTDQTDSHVEASISQAAFALVKKEQL